MLYHKNEKLELEIILVKRPALQMQMFLQRSKILYHRAMQGKILAKY